MEVIRGVRAGSKLIRVEGGPDFPLAASPTYFCKPPAPTGRIALLKTSTSNMKSLSAFLALSALVQAGLRFPCSTLTIQRLDPVVQGGSNPSTHLHHIVGGNAFNVTMTGDVGARGTCTTCQMAEDFSNYWTAHLFFKHPNGSYHRVTPTPVQPLLGGSNGASGGLTVYYTQYDLSKDNLKTQPVTAFQPVRACVHRFL